MIRSRVDLPAPLCPTRPSRSPSRSERAISCSASMIGMRWAVPILPPVLPSGDKRRGDKRRGDKRRGGKPNMAFFNESALGVESGEVDTSALQVDTGHL